MVYGKRGVPGTGVLLNAPHSAHFMPSGPYKGNILITEMTGSHRILILDKNNGTILWSHTGADNPLEAIYWDDDHIMVSDYFRGIFVCFLKGNFVPP